MLRQLTLNSDLWLGEGKAKLLFTQGRNFMLV